MGGTINVASMVFAPDDATDTLLAGVTYASPSFTLNLDSDTDSWVPSGGTYTFSGDNFYIIRPDNVAQTVSIVCSTNDPGFVFQGDVEYNRYDYAPDNVI